MSEWSMPANKGMVEERLYMAAAEVLAPDHRII